MSKVVESGRPLRRASEAAENMDGAASERVNVACDHRDQWADAAVDGCHLRGGRRAQHRYLVEGIQRGWPVDPKPIIRERIMTQLPCLQCIAGGSAVLKPATPN